VSEWNYWQPVIGGFAAVYNYRDTNASFSWDCHQTRANNQVNMNGMSPTLIGQFKEGTIVPIASASCSVTAEKSTLWR
jgi:hypothetical protein